MNSTYNCKVIEKKWQERWHKDHIFEAEPDNREKFFITIPYPYLNGNLHAGHTRTFTIGDVIARYKRMQGYNVLFPMGFHVTGTPIVGLAELIQKKDPQTMYVYTHFHDVPEDILYSLDTSEKIVEYFSKESENAMKSIGFSIDWRRKFTTTDPQYKKFIEWQYNLLYNKGLVVKGSHPVRWCPNDENPVEDHDILRGEEATIIDYTLIKFKLVGVRSQVSGVSSALIPNIILPCATLRPETVFGVTNLWINPDLTYFKIKVNKEIWIVSYEAYEKLKYTDKEIEFIEEVSGKSLIGDVAINPVTCDKVINLPASFVKGENGSGIVMSVPAHAPYDYLALRDLHREREIKPISLIEVPEFGEYPAIEVCEKLKVKDQNDPKAEDATKLVYKKEFHSGVLKSITGKYAGRKVSEIKEVLAKDLIEDGLADVLYDFSESKSPVTCRCGTPCVVKIVKDQWFLNYSNKEWKKKVLQYLNQMQIIPLSMKVEFENKIDWLKDKATVRRKGLGTNLPWDTDWIIESLGDSTIYMSYYIIAKYINLLNLQLKSEVFDYVFLGKSSLSDVAKSTGIAEDVLEKMRSDFEYWYPVDLRSSGKDLVANHLLFFLFHHLAIFPEEKCPKTIAINGFVSLEGQKMSKSKGPLLTLKRAVSEYGADTTRMYILSSAEGDQDADWRRDDVEKAKKQIERFYNTALEVINSLTLKVNLESKGDIIDKWILSRLQYRIKETRNALDNIQTRRALNHAFYELMNDIRWYKRRGGSGSALPEVYNTWIRLMAPFTPHICEEIGEAFGTDGYISLSQYPVENPELIDKNAEIAEELIKNTLQDIEEIIKVTKIKPKKVILYTSQNWKNEVFKLALKLKQENQFSLGYFMKIVMKNSEVKSHAKEVPKFAKKVLEEVQSSSLDKYELDELNILEGAKEFFEREINCKVEVYSADNPKYDPRDKSKFAEPLKPGIYMEE
ncbi:MAG TPA: leucine--tRNA ligase [Methanosarcinales archaeon]|nr:leucine--tRNA ligase [Methanosarcinales archaeon]